MECLLSASVVPSTSPAVLTHLIFTTTPWSENCYHIHFSDKEIEAQAVLTTCLYRQKEADRGKRQQSGSRACSVASTSIPQPGQASVSETRASPISSKQSCHHPRRQGCLRVQICCRAGCQLVGAALRLLTISSSELDAGQSEIFELGLQLSSLRFITEVSTSSEAAGAGEEPCWAAELWEPLPRGLALCRSTQVTKRP